MAFSNRFVERNFMYLRHDKLRNIKYTTVRMLSTALWHIIDHMTTFIVQNLSFSIASNNHLLGGATFSCIVEFIGWLGFMAYKP